MTTTEVIEGDVVQIHPDQQVLGGCFAVVVKVKAWGCIANVPVARDKVAPVRLAKSEFVVIGHAEWTRPD